MSIILGTNLKIKFEGPYPITSWNPPLRAAIYAIMVKSDPVNRPNMYKVLYIGESGNLSERGFYKTHHASQCWLQQAGSLSSLFIAIYLMPSSTEEERQNIEAQLIEEYSPPCNG